MSLAFRRVKVYAQIALISLLILLIAWVLYKNRKNEVAFWFFGFTDPARKYNIVWVLAWTASSTVAIARIFWFARGLWRNFRELRQAEKVEDATEAEEKRTVDLENKQRELDKKLKTLEAGEDSTKEETAPKENDE